MDIHIYNKLICIYYKLQKYILSWFEKYFHVDCNTNETSGVHGIVA